VADGNDLAAILSVGHRTWPLTYEPIAGAEIDVAVGVELERESGFEGAAIDEEAVEE
jgi:hypothetical protein